MRYLLIIYLAFLLLGCEQPVIDNSDLEVDRVWQYLKTYSIYTDKIPSREQAQIMDSPELVALSVMDTIRYLDSDTIFYFTYYNSNWQYVRDGYFPIQHLPRNSRALDTTVYAQKLTDDILYLNIPRFTSSAYSEMLNKSSAASLYDNIIIDLRWNPGGYVDVCTLMVDLLLPLGTHYLKALNRSDDVDINGIAKVDTADWVVGTNGNLGWQNKKIAILMNQYSASASEILIEALKSDSVESRMFGTKTFGKGIGQIHLYFHSTSGGGLSVTTLKFLGTDNSSYHTVGIVPDVEITGDHSMNDIDQVIAAAQYLDPSFNSVQYAAELLSIIEAVENRHAPYGRSARWESNVSFRPMAIVDEIFVEEN